MDPNADTYTLNEKIDWDGKRRGRRDEDWENIGREMIEEKMKEEEEWEDKEREGEEERGFGRGRGRREDRSEEEKSII